MPAPCTQAITNTEVISDACSWSELKAVLGWQATALAFHMERPRRPGRCALERWLAEAEITEGPVFRAVRQNGRVRAETLAPDSAAGLIEQATRRAGLKAFAGHSLRSGHVTQASLNKVCPQPVMRQTRHRSSSSFGRYMRVLGIFDESAAAGLGSNGKVLLSIFSAKYFGHSFRLAFPSR
jgi:hypothetical protein